jgi:hypothetical protein
MLREGVIVKVAERGKVGSVGQGERCQDCGHIHSGICQRYIDVGGLPEKCGCEAQPEAGAVTQTCSKCGDPLATTQTDDGKPEGCTDTICQRGASVAPSVEELDLEELSLSLTVIAWDGWHSGLNALDASRYVEKALRAALERKQSQ